MIADSRWVPIAVTVRRKFATLADNCRFNSGWNTLNSFMMRLASQRGGELDLMTTCSRRLLLSHSNTRVFDCNKDWPLYDVWNKTKKIEVKHISTETVFETCVVSFHTMYYHNLLSLFESHHWSEDFLCNLCLLRPWKIVRICFCSIRQNITDYINKPLRWLPRNDTCVCGI